MTTPIREFETGEYYHVYNQGTDKRYIFLDDYDLKRFVQSMEEFNTTEPTGGIFVNSFPKYQNAQLRPEGSKLVEIIAYCLNPNHFHLLLKQGCDGGISTFMNKLGGYSKYFNLKNERKGTLFQGTFKAKCVFDNSYLLNLSVYINLNDRIHQLKPLGSNFVERSSWKEYVNKGAKGICKKDVILTQFDSLDAYRAFGEEIVLDFIQHKKDTRELLELALEKY